MSVEISFLLAAVEGAEGSESATRLLLPETPELVAGILAFGILYVFVRKWATPAINRSLDARQRAISERIVEAENAKSEAEHLKDQYREELATLESQKAELLGAARNDAEAVKAEVLERAEAEAAEIIAKARVDAENQLNRALAEARMDVANLSVDLAEKVVGASLDRDAHRKLIESFIADLEK